MAAREPEPIRIPKWPFWTAWGIFLAVLLYLGFTTAALTPLTMGVLGLVFSLATILLLSPYLIEHFSQVELTKLAEAEAGDTLLMALRKLDDALTRVQAVGGDVSKSTLVARQIPDRLDEKMAEVEARMIRKESEELTRLRGELEQHREQASTDASALIKELKEATAAARKALDALPEGAADSAGGDTSALAGEIAKLTAKVEQLSGSGDAGDSLRADLDARFVALEAKLDQLTAAPAKKQAPKKTAPKPEPELEFGFVEEVESEPEPEDASIEGPGPDAEDVDDPDWDVDAAGSEATEGVELIAQINVGVANKLYLRGDEPYLSWDEGTEMDLIGIGKWAWHNAEADEPVTCRILLNDDIGADGDDIVLKPGTPLTVKPEFPGK